MVGKIAKWLLGIVGVVLGLVLLVALLAYMPPVQDFVKKKAAAYVSETMGVQLDIERFRLRFPLMLTVRNTVLRSVEGDTLARMGRLRVGVAPLPLLSGDVQVRRFRVSDAQVDWADSAMTVKGRIGSLGLDNVRARPAKGRVRVGAVSVSGMDVDLRLALPADSTAAPSAPVEWTVMVRRVDLDSVSFRMDTITAGLTKGAVNGVRLDLAAGTTDIGGVSIDGGRGSFGQMASVTELHLDAGDIYNKGSDIALKINELSVREGSGLRVTEGRGRFSMDSLGIRLDNLELRTALGTRLKADLRADMGVLTMDPLAAVEGNIDATVATEDVALLYHSLPKELRGRALVAEADIKGLLNNLDINSLHIGLDPFADLRAQGTVRSMLDVDNIAGNVHIDGRFTDLNKLIDTIPLPGEITLLGDVIVGKGVYEPALKVTADGGRLDLEGRVDIPDQSYTARVEAADFPLGYALPLGPVSFSLTADGHGFDPMAPTTAANISATLASIEYNAHNYNDISLAATLDQGHVTGKITGADDAVGLDLNIVADIAPENYRGRITGRIDTLDLAGMGFSATPLAVRGTLDVSAAVAPGVYTADVVLDSILVTASDQQLAIDKTTLTARADTVRVGSSVRSGDIYAVLNSPVGVKRFVADITAAADTVMRQVARRDIRMAAVDTILPPLTLNLQVGRRNAAYRMLAAQGTGFGAVSMTASKSDTTSFRARAVATGFHTVAITLDTLRVGLGIRGDRLAYSLRLANRPGNLEQLALIYLRGDIHADSLKANFNQRNRSRQTGFQFGIEARIADSMLRASLVPAEGRRRGTARTDSLTFAYEPWGVNKGNYVEWRIGSRTVAAALDLQSHEISPNVRRRVTIESLDKPGDIRLAISRLDIAKTLDLMPAPPPVNGMVDLSATLGLGGDMLTLNGTAAGHDIFYDDRRMGDIALKIATNADRGVWNVAADATVNDKQSLSLSGTYDTKGVDLTVDVPSLPLDVANPFLPADMAVLSGELTGKVDIEGPLPTPVIDGSLAFKDGRINVPMVGTTFGISPQQVRISNSRLRLRNFGLTSPNNKLLSLDGTVDISAMTADLHLETNDFQVVNASRTRGSQIYGLAAIDAGIDIKGPFTDLAVEGDTRIRRSTNVVYTMMTPAVSTRSQKQNIVTFVPFTDSLAMELQATKRRARAAGIDLRLSVGIEDEVRATVNLSDNGNDRIELTGGGELALSMNTQGDMRLTGRYALTGGTVVYNPPIPTITQKNFAIAEGSYVSWTGDAMAPEFNISAAQTVRTTVTEEGSGLSRPVDFRISVFITGTLAAMQITFDLAAPDDLTIQNELSSLEPEQRAAQAMALMIYNTYTGPGTTARVESGNAVYSFIEKELNQWARNSLRGVDLSVGIRSEDDGMGGQHTDYSYKVSKNLFNDRVRVTVGGGISDGATAEANMRDNFIDDISLEYRLAQWDNLFLKAYRYNTRESILEGEVVETGGGVLYRKRMETLKDLFRLSKGPQRRAMRREVRNEERRVWRDSIQRDSMRQVWRERRRGSASGGRDSMAADDSTRQDRWWRSDSVNVGNDVTGDGRTATPWRRRDPVSVVSGETATPRRRRDPVRMENEGSDAQPLPGEGATR